MKNRTKQNQTAGHWNSGLSKQEKPLIIAGPCSAETPEQLMEAARALALDGRVDYFRAGIWKPRTTPDSFQGAGAQGLTWLQEVKKETGMRVATEVGSERHVEEALKSGVDLIWIGARTVSNPFIIQEIADSLRGVDIPVLVKNPLSPDIDLWEGALIRLQRAGIAQLGAIHRGFFWMGKSTMRNQPLWHVPLELKKRMPHIPIIGDPSHIAGRRSFISLLSQRAMEYDFSGLMVEVHPDPDKAWSDAKQQLTPKSFSNMLDDLFGNIQVKASHAEILSELRDEIDTMDDMLMWALAARMDLSAKIADVKKNSGLEVLQASRWNQVMERIKMLATQSNLDHCFIEEIYNTIHLQSINVQNRLIKSSEGVTKKEPNFAL
jgi:chorismate mutase